MSGQNVTFLDPRCFVGGNGNQEPSTAPRILPPEAPVSPMAKRPKRLLRTERPYHAEGISGGADSHSHIARTGESLELPGEYLLIAIVVPDSGHRRRVPIERQRWHWTPLAEVTPEEFGCQMLGIRRTAAIAEEDGFMTAAVRLHQGIGRRLHRRQAGVDQALVNLDTALDVFTKDVGIHVRTIPHFRKLSGDKLAARRFLHHSSMSSIVWRRWISGRHPLALEL